MAEFTITESEVAVLKAARAILTVIEDRCKDCSHEVDEGEDGYKNTKYNLGKLSEACDAAETAAFNVLNVAQSYLEVDVGVL